MDVKVVAVWLLMLILTVRSQYYQNPYGYGYPPYSPYQAYPGGYLPYPYASGQVYQPYVSTQPSYSSYPYYYPTQYSAGGQQYSGQPSQAFYATPSFGGGYVPSTYPIYPGYTQGSASNIPDYQPSSKNANNQSEKDPYANVRTDIIDIDPQHFQYYKKYFNLEDNLYPIEVIDQGTPRKATTRSRPRYIVKSESQQTNSSSLPENFHKHEAYSKTYSFKKTFTLRPNNKTEKAVVNLNFVNGVQVTDKPDAEADEDTTIGPVFRDGEGTGVKIEKPEVIKK